MPPPATFGDGTFPAGKIAPGVYRTTTLTDSCLWRLEDERSLGLPVRSRGASEIVEIPAGYNTFSSEGCGTWSTDLKPIITPGQPFGDGTYLVGEEIAPGRYRTISSSDSCSWQATGQFGRYTERVASDAYEIGTAGSSVVVDIEPGDLAFRSYGCGVWTENLAPIVAFGQPFGEGAFLVGSEIAPGRYRSTSSTRTCFWARLSSFRWSISGNYYRGDAAYLRYWDDHDTGDESIVTIASADAGFVSYGCGSWLPFTVLIEPGRPFGSGTFLVGDEVAPGRYRTTSYSDDCVWQRLSGDARDLEYIQWGDTTIVDIPPTDGGFDSHGCGTWSSDLSSSIAPGQPFGERHAPCRRRRSRRGDTARFPPATTAGGSARAVSAEGATKSSHTDGPTGIYGWLPYQAPASSWTSSRRTSSSTARGAEPGLPT